jgi:hypothetical protein
VAPWDKDRYFHPDLVAAADTIRANMLVKITEKFLETPIEHDEHGSDSD